MASFFWPANSGAVTWKPPVPSQADLPATLNTAGDARVAIDTGIVYVWSGSSWNAPSGAGTVTSVAITVPNILSVAGSPITGAGTFALSLANQTGNTVFSSPANGSNGTPTFRSLVSADIPALAYVTSVAMTVPAILSVSGSPVTSSGTLALTLATQSANIVFAGPTTGSAATPTFRSLVSADIPALAYVTSVAMTVPAILSVSGSPVTSSGTLALSLATQNKNLIFAGPTTGSAATPAFRALVGADLPLPAAATLGGVFSKAVVSHNFLTGISSVDGSVSAAQPGFSDILGTVDASQLPLPGASSLGGVFSKAVVSHNFLTGISSVDGSVSAAQPAFTDISGTASLTTQVTGILPIANGGTNASTAAGARASLCIAPTLQAFLSPPYYTFTVTAANATRAATYTNNGKTFTVVYTIAGGTTLVCSGTGDPASSGTLTKSGGTGDSTITFSAFAANGTYQVPTTTPLYIRIVICGAGGGGGGSGTSGNTAGGTGGSTTFGFNIISANGGLGGGAGNTGGGTGNSAPANTFGIFVSGGDGGGGGSGNSGSGGIYGGWGGNNALGGGGGGGNNSPGAGNAGKTNTGGGGGGAGGLLATSQAQPGGGAGGYIDAIYTSNPNGAIFTVGIGGTAGTGGTSGAAGGAGGSGAMWIWEYYQ